MKGLSLKEKGFFFCMYILAIIGIIVGLCKGYYQAQITDYSIVMFFVLITGITESITFCFNGLSFSTTFAITLATYILLGPFQGMIILLGGFLIRVLKIGDNQYKHIFNTPFYGTLFNCSMLVITLVLANFGYLVSTDLMGNGYYNVIPILVFSMIHLVVNNFIIAILIWIKSGKNIIYCFGTNIKLTFLNYLIMVPFGIILTKAFLTYEYWGIIFILFPILLVKYTFTYYAEAQSQFIQTVATLMNAMEARDKYTQGHSHRVAEIAVILGKELGFNQWKVEKLRIAAMLHDVGKMGISDNILNKPGKLTDEEFNIIKSHPTIGSGIIKDIKNLQYVVPIVKHHHERYDGKGYPEGKSGEELDIGVYIIQLADTIDAMASDRPYRKGLPKEVIMEEVNKYLGTQFHPKVAAAYLKIAQTSQELDQIWESE
ncbi:MAG: HD-GYP domain-containing protein [Cellulosilyticaceae bacterium]